MADRNRAEYMREYRARKLTEAAASPGTTGISAAKAIKARDAEIMALQEEVRQLKQELAARPAWVDPGPLLGGSGTFGRSYPAPKPGKKK